MEFNNAGYFTIPDLSTNQCLKKHRTESEAKQSFASFVICEIVEKFSSYLYIQLVCAIAYIIRFFF